MWPCLNVTSQVLLRICKSQDAAIRQALLSRNQFTSLTSLARLGSTAHSMPFRHLSVGASRCSVSASALRTSDASVVPTSLGAQLRNDETVVARQSAARMHTSCMSASAQQLAASTSQSLKRQPGSVDQDWPVQESGRIYDGYAVELAPGAALEGGDAIFLSIDEDAVLEEAAEALQEKEQRMAKRRGKRSVANGSVLGSSALAQEQIPMQQGRRASGARPQREGRLSVGDEVDLVCQSLAFGGQVASLAHPLRLLCSLHMCTMHT